MTKKKKYTPGYLTRQVAIDLQKLQKAKEILDAYYEAQEQKQLLEANDSTNTEKSDSIVEDQSLKNDSATVSDYQKPLKQSSNDFGSYKAQTPEEYLKYLNAGWNFDMSIIPSIFDPNYREWADKRSDLATNSNGDYYNYRTKLHGLVASASVAARDMFNSFDKRIEDGNETYIDKLNRRIQEHNLLRFTNKDFALTDDELKEIDNYKIITDPVYAKDRIEQIFKELGVKQEEEQLIEQPENYFGEKRSLPVGMGGSFNAGIMFRDLLKSAWAKSFFSDFMEETNASQMKTSVGQIQRAKELLDLSDTTFQNVDLIEEYANNLAQLERYTNKIIASKKSENNKNAIKDDFYGLNLQEREIYSDILEKNKEIQQTLYNSNWWKDANNLASWAPSPIMGRIAQKVDAVIDDDLGGIRGKLYGLDDKLDELRHLLDKKDHTEDWLNGVVNLTGSIKKQLNEFNHNADTKKEYWQEQALVDAQDLYDWRTGNNWMNTRVEIDPYYAQLKKIIENSEFDWSDPVKMALFGWSGVAGGSNSSWWKSIIGMSAKAAGAIGGAITTGGTSTVIQVGAIATSFEADKSAGSDENNIETVERTSNSLRDKLIASGKYADFLEEGEEQLKRILKEHKDDDIAKKALESSKSDEKRSDFIMTMFLAGVWHSIDPEITKMHADAVIGTNNQFYNDQPVNTADAAIGSIVDIANLEPVKYLARSTKIITKSAGTKLAETAIGKSAALKYAGFKEGVHNVTNTIVDSKIANLIENGTIKTLGAASKVPSAAYIGSLSGASIGYAETDGSALGTIGGALVGTGSGYLLHKGSNWLGKTNLYIGIEDKIAKGYLTTRAFATKIPKVWMYASDITKGGLNIGTRISLDTGSEMLQEGVQALNARDEGVDYDIQYNRPMIDRIFDDLMLGAKSAYIWMNQNDPEFKSESEVYSQMNATPLLTLFGPGNILTVMQARNTIRDLKMSQIVANNIDAERRGNIAELELGREYAKYLSKEDKEQMKEKFENFRKIAGTHADAMRKLNPEQTQDALMMQDEHFIPTELINEQEKDYEDIYTLANSVRMRILGARAGAKPGSDKYAQIVSLENFMHKKKTESFLKLGAKDEELYQLLGQDALEDYVEQKEVEDLYNDEMFYGEGQMDTALGKKIRSKNDLAKMLVHAATLMQIVDDYSAIQELTGKEDVFLNRSKARLEEIKKELSKNGIPVETRDDVINTLNMSEEGMILKTLITQGNRKLLEKYQATRERQRNNFEEDYTQEDENFTMEDYVDAYSSVLRQRELLEFDALIQDQLYEDFLKNPEYYVEKWNNRLKSDQLLEQILENEWINDLRDYQSAAAREVKDGDIYLGYDENWYIVKQKGDKVEKHRFHPPFKGKPAVIDQEALKFDPVEYDKSLKREEQSRMSSEAVGRANKNILTGNVKSNEQMPANIEPTTEEIPTEATEEVAPPPQESDSFQIGDFVTDGIQVGQIVEKDEDSYTISYGHGKPELVVKSSNLQKVTSPIEKSKYKLNLMVTDKNGNTYAVTDVYLEDIDNDTYKARYTYNLLNVDTGDILVGLEQNLVDELSKLDIEQSNGSNVTPNEILKEVLSQLEDKRKSDEKTTRLNGGKKRVTGNDYIIKIKNKLQKFIRVHGILDNLFDESQELIENRNQLRLKLQALYDKSKKEFLDEVLRLQDEYNKNVAEKYKGHPYEIEYYSIDLSFYLKSNILNDNSIVDAIASILSSEQIGVAGIVGSIIDEIARDFFDPAKTLENKKQYRISDATFNSIVRQLNKLQERFDLLGWVVDTNPYTWYGQFNNGRKIAGETDMIAIDRQGHIHILDFKTTSSDIYEPMLEYKTVDLEGNEVWAPVIDKDTIPEGVETRVSYDFFNKVAQTSNKLGKRTYAAQYARQLEIYRLLILQQTGRKVSSLEIIPFYVQYDIENDVLSDINEVLVYDPMDLTAVPELQQEISDIDNFLLKNGESVTSEEIQSAIDEVGELLLEIKQKIEQKGVTVDTKVAIFELLDLVKTLQHALNKIKNNPVKLADDVFVNGLLKNKEDIVKELNYLIRKASEEVLQYALNNDENPPILDDPKLDADRSWLWEESEIVSSDEKSRWWHFNSLHSFTQEIKKMKNYMKSIIQSDFVKNSKFIISRSEHDVDVFYVDVIYRGVKVNTKPIAINLGKNDACPRDMRNYQTPMDLYLSAQGRNFVRQYYQLAKTLKPGEVIVAKKVTRTNGVIRYAGKNINLQDTKFFSKNDPRFTKLINGEDSLVGVSIDGTIREVGSGNREVIWSPEIDPDGNVALKKIREKVVPGNVGSESIPDGVVVFIHKFKNEEDPEDGDFREVPLVLQGRNLSEKDQDLIIKILSDISNSKSPKKAQNDLYNVQVVEKDGTTRMTTVPGLTNMKVLNLLVRFGGLAEHAGNDFIFDYASKKNKKIIRITDMRATATEDSDGNLHRPTIDLNLTKAEDIVALREILSLTQMHINQMGIMRADLNTDDENSQFGALRSFFMNEENRNVKTIKLHKDLQIDEEDVFADKNDASIGLQGIGWYIKHGYAGTNAVELENPIISIQELGVENKKQKKGSEQKKKEITQKTVSSEESLKPAEQQQPSDKKGDEKRAERLARIRQMLDEEDDDSSLPGFGRMVSKTLRKKPISEEEKAKIEKRLRRLVGRVAVKWTYGAIETLKSGAQVAGRTAISAFELSDRLTKGTEFHEAFHRIFEILIPNSQRQKLYDIYREKNGELFKKQNGREITDRDISEEFAEMFRIWMLNKLQIKFLRFNVLKTFLEIKNYIDQLKSLGDRRFAALFLLANSGIFRFVKPNAKNVEHFKNVLGGMSDLRISAKDKKGKIQKVELNMFPSFGGRSLFNDAVDGIIYALFHNYSIDMLASNAARLKTSREDIANLFRGKEKTKHSAWFRVLTGEYTDSDEEFTIEDANAFYRMYKQSDVVMDIAELVLDENPDIDSKSFKAEIIARIYEQEINKEESELDYKQKLMRQLFAEDTWWAVEKKINNKLHKMCIDSERLTEEEYTKRMDFSDEDHDDDDGVSKDIGDHKDEFYDHARTDDATAAVRFFLSTIPDERFATEEDVEKRLVRSTKDKDGNPITISNSTNLLGYLQYLSMKIVSNKLLLACHDVRTVQELDERLLNLASVDPVFFRIAKKYRYALNNEIKKTPSGKNVITVGGKIVPEEMYQQEKDELGWYYIWTDAGENPGQRIEGAVTQTNPDLESFVTQLFNYVACQKLDFIMVTLKQEIDSDGDVVEGKYTSVVRSSDSDYAASVYPKAWFVRLRSGVSGIFKITNSSKYTFTAEGKSLFHDAIKTIKLVETAFLSKGAIKIHGRALDRNNEDDFRSIENEFIKALNTLGIDISREALEYYLQQCFGKDISIRRAFGLLITRADKDTSFRKFVSEMEDFKDRVTERGLNLVLTKNEDEDRVRKIKRSGTYIYSSNGFVNWLSRAVGQYNKVTSEIMQNGPEGTKRYLLSLSHTASDITDDLNNAVIIDGEIKGSRIMKDMYNYIYNTIKGFKGLPKGSIIIKQLFMSSEKKLHLVLHTHGGVKVDTDYSGGVSYKKITEREDWLGKAAILKQGGIIFPTLSDKSTWFYLTGVPVPGINYGAISQMSSREMMHIGLHKGQYANSKEAHITFDFRQPNQQLDQMIEYAECERAAIEREINRGKKGTVWEKLKKLPIIEFFNDNKNRFGGLSEVVIIDNNGKAKLEIINDYDLTPEKCLEKADQLFFSKTQEEKRRIMALTLEEGFKRNLEMLERAGLISASDGLEEQELDKDGNPTGKFRQLDKLMQYKNIGLDSEAIGLLKLLYLSEYSHKGKNVTSEQSMRAESLAICAYVWDIYLRGVISNEETERMYTGQGQFFKWKHKKIKDSISGKVMNVITDRHSDQSKRLGGLGSTGDKNRTDLANQRRTYKCAEVEDLIIKSKLFDTVKERFIDNSVRDAYVRYKEEEIRKLDLDDDQINQLLDQLNDSVYGENKKDLEEIKNEFYQDNLHSVYEIAVKSAEDDANAYSGDINVADGAAYIRPQMAKSLLRQRGRYTSKVKEAFDILEGRVRTEDGKRINALSNKDAYMIVLDALLGAQKYSAYGYRVDQSTGDIPVHYYNKFALFPIFPQIATGFTGDILNKMEEQGIDMLMMHSAVKTGSQDPLECSSDKFSSPEDFKKFKFNTYEQDFAFIRRQLNTDPHELESDKITAMGTQMTKIALTNINMNREYTLDDGTKIRGRHLLKDVMDCIKDLSNIGKKHIEDEFFTDGEFDLQKFSAFLEQELEQRDADANLLDGIEVVEDEDGVQHFKVPLEAMSSVDWILSILVSKINKEVCDINVKGSALYQRSVWGMEGKPVVLDDEKVNFKLTKINGGNDLQMINEEGSMDAVVSMDYFYDILPEGIRNDFNKSKQWLIDHDIISGTKSNGVYSNAKANTISSRIPTLAQSSIHALRFVDVIPVVRDTIILPKEFTAITGADFDIDKLYLVRFGYRVSTQTIDGKKVDTVSYDYDKEKSPENYYRNKLISSYLSLLKSHGKQNEFGIVEGGDSMHISMRPIDNDTNLIKDVLKRIEENRPEERSYAYKFGNIAFQVATKMAFMIGKFGISPFALNNNNQILTLLYGVKFSKSSTHTNILDAIGCLSLCNKVDKNGKMILSWLSGLINAHVDVAKDPYIRRLNINNFTYNLVNLLIRTGMGERTLLFTSQPIMVELARVYDDASGSFMVDINKSKSARQKAAIKDFIIDSYKRGDYTNGDIKFINEMMMGPKNSDEQNQITEEVLGSYAKALFGIDENGNYEHSFQYIDPQTGNIIEKQGCILEDIITNTDALVSEKGRFTFDNMQDNIPLYRVFVKNRNGETTFVDMTPKLVLLYVFFIQHSLSKYGQKLSDLVNACKIDTKKQGKNYVEHQAYMSKYNEVFDNIDGVFESKGLTDLKENSYVDTKTKNAVELYERILGEFSIQSTAQFKVAHDRILKKLNSSSQNKQLSKKVQVAIMTWLKSKFFEEYVNQKGKEYFSKLFFDSEDSKSIQSRLVELQNKIRRDTDGEFSKFGENGDITLGENGQITNPLLKALLPDVYEDSKDFLHPLFVKLENALLDDSENANAIERAWDELLRDEYHYTEDEDGTRHYYVKELAEDLAIYAFLTSGDRTGTTKFFKFVPNTIRTLISIEKADGETMSYAQYMADLQEKFHSGEFEFSEEDLNDIIGLNWRDNDFVKEIRMTVKRKGLLTSCHTSLGKIVLKSSAVVSYKKGNGKIGFKRQTLQKTFNILIAGIKKTKKGLKETIYVTNDDSYPPFIKTRRSGSTKYDADNYLLYKFKEVRQMDPNDESKGVYPVYQIVNPTVSNLRAGSYDYVLFDFGEDSCSYPEEILRILRQLYNDPITTEQEANKALGEFVEKLNEMGVSLENEELDELLRFEFDSREFEYTDEEMQKAVKYVKSKLTSKELTEKKTTKKEVNESSNDDKISVNDLFGEDEDQSGDESLSKDGELFIEGTEEIDVNDLDDSEFDPIAMNTCKLKKSNK